MLLLDGSDIYQWNYRTNLTFQSTVYITHIVNGAQDC